MNRRAKRLYDLAPNGAQTVALNALGLWQRRRWAAAGRLAESLSITERWSREQQRAYVDRRLRVVLLHAVEFVPRYRAFRRLERHLEDPSSDVFALLAEFPFVTRADVAERPTEYLSQAFRPNGLRVNATSGTTGSPLHIWVEPAVERVNDGLIRRRDLWAGYRRGDWIARLVGDPVVPLERSVGAPYRVSVTDRRVYLSTYHLSRETAPEFAQVLSRRRPSFLMGYPSALEALSRWADVDLGEWRPKAVLFSSEPMLDHQREVIQSFVNAPLRGFYGSAERVVSAAQCEAGTYHLSLVDGYVEHQFDVSSPSSVSGAATPVTTLLNRAMPLIRYELGDTLNCTGDATCPCGRTLPMLSPVLTKAEDVVETPSGRLISPSILTWAFKDVPGLQRSQVVQRDATSLEVLVVVDEGALPGVQALLRDRVGRLVFGEMFVAVTGVRRIALTANGKTRFVVNECCQREHGERPTLIT